MMAFGGIWMANSMFMMFRKCSIKMYSDRKIPVKCGWNFKRQIALHRCSCSIFHFNLLPNKRMLFFHNLWQIRRWALVKRYQRALKTLGVYIFCDKFMNLNFLPFTSNSTEHNRAIAISVVCRNQSFSWSAAMVCVWVYQLRYVRNAKLLAFIDALNVVNRNIYKISHKKMSVKHSV